MKQLVLTLCIFVFLSSQADAADPIWCYDITTGKTIKTSNPPPGAICEGMRGGDDVVSESTKAARKIDRRTDKANDEIEDLIAKLSVQTYTPTGQRHSMYKNYEQIVELRKAQLRNGGNRRDLNVKIEDLIDKLSQQTYDSSGRPHSMSNNNSLIVELRNAQLQSQGSTSNGNQQTDMEDKMRRQQREMEDKANAMNAQMMHQQAEMQRLQDAQRWSEHNQRMQQLRKDMGQ